MKLSWEEEIRLTYHCRHCSFVWESWEGDFKNVLAHEKTHKNHSGQKRSKKQNDDIKISETEV